MELNPFPCNSCGLCCQNIGHIEELKSYDLGNGTCKYLIDQKCSIYESRPLICRIEEMYEKVFFKQFTKEEYYLANLKACKKLQVEYSLSEKDQIDLTKYWGEFP
ncbi:YkgJ family cysteine cluster protein [Rossellomorea aquimaris]|uniref:YkgJ family cysteine cluster protein n=1 Tax=Rossellomorea aquimaris TaxID=189382 RepID=UPI0007D079E7